MKLMITFLGFFAANFVFADDEYCKKPTTYFDSFYGYIEEIIEKCKDPKEEALKKLAEQNKDEVKPVSFHTEPSATTCSSVEYKLPYEQKLMPNEAAYFHVPEELRKETVTTTTLSHRQDANTESNKELKEGDHDSVPGITSVQVHSLDKDPKEAWRYYQASWGASGAYGGKFAEIRSSYDPEVETMESWRAHGHRGVHSGDQSSDSIYADAVRLVNTGKDPVYISMLKVNTAPSKPDKELTTIFTPGTSFENYSSGEGQSVGGGEKAGGKYPDALHLNGDGIGTTKQLPEGWKYENGMLVIDVPAGYSLKSVDVSCGDMHPDGKTNHDGSSGTPGWSKLSVGYAKNNGYVDWVLKNSNVPKDGVITAYPRNCDNETKTGDKIYIKASSDVAYLMGVRISLKKK